MDKNLKVVITAQDEASSKLDKISSSASNMDKTLSSVGKSVSGSMGNITRSFSEASREAFNLASVGIAGLVAGTGALSMKALNVAGDLQQIELGIKTLTGSSKEASEIMKGIKIDASKTPFDLREIAKANQMLISTGLSGEESRKAVLDLGNAIVATGGDSSTFNRMIGNLQQIKNIGKATEMDIRQFGFAGINIYKLLEASTGKSIPELKEMEITYEMIAESLAKAREEGGAFAGALENQGNSWNLLKANLNDVINIILSDIVKGTGAFEFMNNKLLDLVNYLNDNKKAFVDFFVGLKENPNVINFFNTLKTVFEFLSTWVSKNGELIKNFLISLGVAFSALSIIGGIIALINPFVGYLTLITLAITALKTAWDNNLYGIKDTTEQVLNSVSALWNTHKEDILYIVEGITNLFNAFLNSLKDYWKRNGDEIKTIVTSTMKILSSVFGAYFNNILQLIKFFIAIFKGDFKEAWEAVTNINKNNWNIVKTIFEEIPKIASAQMKILYNNFTSWFGKIWELATNMAGKIRHAISSAFDKDKKNSPSIMEVLNDTIKAVNNKMFEFSSPEPLAHSPMFSNSSNSTNNNVNVNFNNVVVRNDNDIDKIAQAVKQIIDRENYLYSTGAL